MCIIFIRSHLVRFIYCGNSTLIGGYEVLFKTYRARAFECQREIIVLIITWVLRQGESDDIIRGCGRYAPPAGQMDLTTYMQGRFKSAPCRLARQELQIEQLT